MNTKLVRSVVLLLLALTCRFSGAQAPASLAPSDSKVRQILADRIDTYKKSRGIVVGVVTAQGTSVVAYGAHDEQDNRALSADSVFEIGSISKVFTALLLMDMVQRGEVKLEDPVAKYLPTTVLLPSRNGKVITLVDLAMHVSGLPRMPSNIAPKDPTNPYADYTVQQMYEFLSKYQLTRDVGEQYEYSNLGAGLLGHSLALRAGTDYETLLRERILQPLGMKSTGIALTPDMRVRLVPGHTAALRRTSNWDIPTLAGAGAIRSTVKDMLTFLAANMGIKTSRLEPAMKAMLSKRHSAARGNVEIAIGWHILNRFGNEIIWHNGGTGGYHSFIGFDPRRQIGIVVLSNSANDIDDIGRHLLDPHHELAKLTPTKEHKEIAVDPKIYDEYVGVYEFTPAFKITITREGNKLYEQATGQGRLQIHPESVTGYFLTEVDAQITFEKDAKGQVFQLILHQGGIEQRAKRVSAATPVRKSITVASEISAAYVGKYELAPNFILTITSEKGALFLQATGQPRFEMLAESETNWFLKEVDAQITFVRDAGKVNQVILHQNAANMPARRIE
ncbi:MAG TPA: serine hydrolase [Terriglobales bacterium]|nr:serine hydrolase [Terriglobales bacterium]